MKYFGTKNPFMMLFHWFEVKVNFIGHYTCNFLKKIWYSMAQKDQIILSISILRIKSEKHYYILAFDTWFIYLSVHFPLDPKTFYDDVLSWFLPKLYNFSYSAAILAAILNFTKLTMGQKLFLEYLYSPLTVVSIKTIKLPKNLTSNSKEPSS